MTTAADLINRSLRLIGALAEGETPSAESSADALSALNTMLDGWSIERLTVFSTGTQVVDWPAGQVSATFGPTGSLGVNVRAISIGDSTYFTDVASGFDYPLKQINQDFYNSISSKTLSASFPDYLYVNAGFPDMTLSLYPAPTKPIRLHIVSVTPFVRLNELTDELMLPPGYERAIVFNLAEELGPEFGVKAVNPTITRLAIKTKQSLQRINAPLDLMEMPAGMPGMRTWTNIYTGE